MSEAQEQRGHMRLPGFTADASLSGSRFQYSGLQTGYPAGGRHVQQQQFRMGMGVTASPPMRFPPLIRLPSPCPSPLFCEAAYQACVRDIALCAAPCVANYVGDHCVGLLDDRECVMRAWNLCSGACLVECSQARADCLSCRAVG
jgi:hypothetical protein